MAGSLNYPDYNRVVTDANRSTKKSLMLSKVVRGLTLGPHVKISELFTINSYRQTITVIIRRQDF